MTDNWEAIGPTVSRLIKGIEEEQRKLKEAKAQFNVHPSTQADDLRDDVRADRLINEWRQDGILVDESHARQLTEHFRRVRENERDNLQPGDVLPNGWVAPDEPLTEMIDAAVITHWPDGAVEPYPISGDRMIMSYKVMRAAAIREREG